MSNDKRNISRVWSVVSEIADDGSMYGRQDYQATEMFGTGEMGFTIHGVGYRVVVEIGPGRDETTDE